MARLLEGKPIAEKIKEDLKVKVASFGKKISLASIQVGENPSSEVYIKSQTKTAQGLGIEFALHKLDKDITQEKLGEYIQGLNKQEAVNGIIIQMPLPQHLDYKKVSQYIDPKKDVEGMHPVNMGKIVFGKSKILPCTAAAVMELISSLQTELTGKEVVIVGHSEIVGKPLALLLLDKLATVTVCHIGTSKAGKLADHVKTADILIVAVGKAGLIKGEWIKQDAVVIDVGINRVADKIVGDVEFQEAEKRASYITPVPGGVGPLTVTMLMRNLVETSIG